MSRWSRALDLVLDPTIVLSFDRRGYRRHARSFDARELAVRLDGRRALVTGANSGIGYATAAGLARLGAEVLLCCRSAERGAAAVAALRAETGSERLEARVLDVSSLASVGAFVRALGPHPVDVLVHNAGVLPATYERTAEGLELTWATNVFGPFALTAALWSRLCASPDGRLVFVSSGGMYAQRLAFDELEHDAAQAPFDGVRAYARTKRAQVVLGALLAERAAGTSLTVATMHPGWADTPAVSSSLPGFHARMQRVLRTPAEGADTVVWLAAAAKVAGQGGRFWFDRRARATHYLPWTRERAADRAALWRLCEEKTGAAIGASLQATEGPTGRP